MRVRELESRQAESETHTHTHTLDYYKKKDDSWVRKGLVQTPLGTSINNKSH